MRKDSVDFEKEIDNANNINVYYVVVSFQAQIKQNLLLQSHKNGIYTFILRFWWIHLKMFVLCIKIQWTVKCIQHSALCHGVICADFFFARIFCLSKAHCFFCFFAALKLNAEIGYGELQKSALYFLTQFPVSNQFRFLGLFQCRGI